MSLADLNIVECGGQRTEEWFKNHIGMLTSSRIADAITKRKRDPGTPLQAYLDLQMELAYERISNKNAEHFVSKWMERGAELEPLARAAYEDRSGDWVSLVDLVLHPDRQRLLWAGCSPDGLCGDELIEIKCPKPETHGWYRHNECVPEEYIPQMMWQLACCPGYKANVFISYSPEWPPPLDLFICRLPRDEKRIAEMEAEAVKFLADVEVMVKRLKGGIEGALRESLLERGVGIGETLGDA